MNARHPGGRLTVTKQLPVLDEERLDPVFRIRRQGQDACVTCGREADLAAWKLPAFGVAAVTRDIGQVGKQEPSIDYSPLTTRFNVEVRAL